MAIRRLFIGIGKKITDFSKVRVEPKQSRWFTDSEFLFAKPKMLPKESSDNKKRTLEEEEQ